jgi:hypothetical protein
MTDFEGLLKALASRSVSFIIIGGAAATAHGSARLTLDLDVVYRRDDENLRRLADALDELGARLRGAPPTLPFRPDAATLRHGLNFTLTTRLGDLDLFGEIAGGGGYADLEPHCDRLVVFGISCLCLGIDKLIEVKTAAGRAKDLETVAELEILREEREKRGD